MLLVLFWVRFNKHLSAYQRHICLIAAETSELHTPSGSKRLSLLSICTLNVTKIHPGWTGWEGLCSHALQVYTLL